MPGASDIGVAPLMSGESERRVIPNLPKVNLEELKK